ncbi:hypothetical protein ES332_A13G127700v1 [Gossypium tomentosum]|uniref:Uncharacterized protein n=1 Tax=Gossypium tomentosum TaxID=34277 RepID=A0A5D2MJA6_GOSTO|nr:hypothetical protein ES332_A13G127700v1 [Gossypium tomentosum]
MKLNNLKMQKDRGNKCPTITVKHADLRIGSAPTSWPSWLVLGSGVRGLHALNEPPPEPPYTVVRVLKTLPFLCRFSGTCKKSGNGKGLTMVHWWL